MASGLNLTSFDAALKEHYSDDRVEVMSYEDNALFALTSKMEDFGGRGLPIPIVYGNPQARSVNFATAQSRSTVSSSQLKYWELKRVKDYSFATIDNETMEASKGDNNAFLEAATLEIDGSIHSLVRSIATAQYRSGYGDIGQIGSISTTTITLLDANSVTNFEVGMMLDLSATQSGALRSDGSSGNGLIITGIDRSAGVLTFGFNVTDSTNGIPAAAANDYIFQSGDHVASTLTKIAGLEAWLPATAPTAGDSFFGMDRSADASRLAGQRFNGVALPIEEVLTTANASVAREGGKLSHFFMNYAKYSALENALGSKVQYVDVQMRPEISFRGIMVNGVRGPIRVIPDQNCPNNRIFGLQLDTFKVYSLGKAVRVIDTDGLQMLRQATSDGVEVRYGMYGNQGCRAPGYNINIQV
jgi:hypothetical protein